MKSLKQKTFLFFILFLLSSEFCSAKTKLESRKYDESELYKSAMHNLHSNNLKTAKKSFQKVGDIYPFSYWGKKAHMMAAFASYLDKDYADATALAESYIKLYPEEDHEYFYNLSANAYFKMIKDINNDSDAINKAKEGFEYMIQEFADSKYAPKAKEKLLIIHEMKAAKIMSVGIFYQKNALYHSAMHRFLQIKNDYQDTKYYEEALFRIAQVYSALDLDLDAQKYLFLLKKINSKWYKKI